MREREVKKRKKNYIDMIAYDTRTGKQMTSEEVENFHSRGKMRERRKKKACC